MIQDRVARYIAAHDQMGHDGIGCGCLDALDGLRADDPASDLTLSARPDDLQPLDLSPSALAVLLQERDPAIVTESELRLLWGDR